MELSEKEKLEAELELLELEEAEEKSSLPLGEATAIREKYPSEKLVPSWLSAAASTVAGMLRKTPVAGAITAGAASAGTEALRQGVQAYSGEPYQPYTPAERIQLVGRAGIEGALGESIARGIGVGAKPLMGGFVKPASQIMKVGAGVDERVGQRVLGEPGRLSRALPQEEAGQIYGEALENVGLKQGPRATMELMGEAALGEKEATKFAYDALRKLKTNDLTYQEALVARDQIKNLIKRPKFMNPDAAQSERFLIEMQQDLDNYLEPYFQLGGKSFEEARDIYSVAKDKQAFSSWLPTNANRTAAVLRTGAGVGILGGGYATENPMTAGIGLAAMSPKMLGLAIQAGQSPVTRGVVGAGMRMAAQENIRKLPNSTEELLRKKYQEQK